jgi:hypothetical protein
MLYPKIIFAVLQEVNFLANKKAQIQSRFCVESVKKIRGKKRISGNINLRIVI